MKLGKSTKPLNGTKLMFALRSIASIISAFIKQVYLCIMSKSGRQSLNSLKRQGEALAYIVVLGEYIELFHTAMREHNIDYALTRNKKDVPIKHTVFFREKDTPAMSEAFMEYTKCVLDKMQKKKPRQEV